MTELNFRALVDAIAQLAWSATADGHVDYYNQPFYDYTGSAPELLMGWGWKSVHHPDELLRVVERWTASLESGEAFEMPYLLRRSDGVYRWFLTRVVPVRDASDRIVRWYGTSTDIDDQRRVEQALSEALAREKRARIESAELYENARMAEEQQARRAEQAAMASAVAVAFTTGLPLRETLQRCCEASIEHLAAAFARIWTLSADGATLELQASSGMHDDFDGPHARVPVGRFEIGLVASKRRPYWSNELARDLSAADPAWAEREGMSSFAAYPLVIEDQLVGVMALLSRRVMLPDTLSTLSSVADIISVGIARKRIDQAVKESEERYRFLSDFVPAQVWTALPNGMLDHVNQQVLAYFRCRFEEAIGVGWVSFVHPDDVAAAGARWTHSITSGEPYEQEFRLRNGPDGAYRWHLARALPQRNAGGEITRWFGINSDMEASKQSEREREQLIHALAQSNDDLDRFAYVASHDLKAPLRGITNLSEWIEQDMAGTMTPQTRDQMTLLRGRVQRMSALIDGILDYARADRTMQKSEDIAVGALLTEIVELLSVPAAVRVEIAPAMPTVHGERSPLQQVFMNLIGNAVKHGARGNGVVRVGFVASGDAYDFWVADQGEGIDPKYHDRVWEIFQMLKPRDVVEGTGIGLAVVKKLVEKRGGRVWIDSAVGSGATFHFLWPRRYIPTV